MKKKPTPKNKITYQYISNSDAFLLRLIFQIEGGPLKNRLVDKLTSDGKMYYDECVRNPVLLGQLTVSDRTTTPHHC